MEGACMWLVQSQAGPGSQMSWENEKGHAMCSSSTGCVYDNCIHD